MKISGPEKAIFAVTAAFLVFTGGYFLGGRGSDAPYTVDTQTVWTGEVGDKASVSVRPDSVNINTATAEELQSLPGIGRTRAEDIIADRAVNGPFRIPEDLMRVPGIGEGTLNEILEYITVE